MNSGSAVPLSGAIRDCQHEAFHKPDDEILMVL